METLTLQQKQTLLTLARNAIGRRLGLPGREVQSERQLLNQAMACFVTLKIKGELRGCVGTLEPRHPLWQGVQRMAVAAAFEDSRFAPLTADEWPQVKVSISLLTPSEPLLVSGETELLQRLTPGEDGLTLDFGQNHATFLPAVWESLPKPADFVLHLKRKAGLDPEFWSDKIHWFRYHAINFSEAESGSV
ncbi:AmmeMemoRadiSam system protein A [Ferrimonas futtsuensis]|uniref:AmmeMemoRadiSam system protein A n=1 Tax=Ferrimonas futtsuensis TaxID=364764 RepID=UPI0004838E29|nr:AmmeMemoRadiSam system protein A [Ferrimonas futtsuensis]